MNEIQEGLLFKRLDRIEQTLCEYGQDLDFLLLRRRLLYRWYSRIRNWFRF